MEEIDHHQSDRERAPETRNDAIDGASSDPAPSRRSTNPAQFVSAGMWHGQSIAERDSDQQLMMAHRRRLEYVVVTDPGAGLPPGYLEHNKVGHRILTAMGYKVGMGIGKNPGIRIPPERPRCARGGRLGGTQEPMPSSATENLPSP